MKMHYDPHYERSQSNNFSTWNKRQRIEADSLQNHDIERLAARILALES
jgi:tRNA 2-selenouridine synthase